MFDCPVLNIDIKLILKLVSLFYLPALTLSDIANLPIAGARCNGVTKLLSVADCLFIQVMYLIQIVDLSLIVMVDVLKLLKLYLLNLDIVIFDCLFRLKDLRLHVDPFLRTFLDSAGIDTLCQLFLKISSLSLAQSFIGFKVLLLTISHPGRDAVAKCLRFSNRLFVQFIQLFLITDLSFVSLIDIIKVVPNFLNLLSRQFSCGYDLIRVSGVYSVYKRLEALKSLTYNIAS